MKIFTAILPKSAVVRLSVNGERMCTSTDKLSLGGLLRNSLVKITDHQDMTSAAYEVVVFNQRIKQGNVSRFMRKPAKTNAQISCMVIIYNNNNAADQRFRFPYIGSTILCFLNTPASNHLLWSRWLSGRASASGSGGRGFDPRPRHTKGVKNGTSGYLAWCSAL